MNTQYIPTDDSDASTMSASDSVYRAARPITFCARKISTRTR